MIAKLFKKKSRPAGIASPSLPEGLVAWAIGDVHGRLDLLAVLTEALIADAARYPEHRKVVVFLGDYVDRGPDSRGVLRHLARLPNDIGIEWRFLKGNHEKAMLDFLSDPRSGSRWCEYGGGATLNSYGLRPPHLSHRDDAWAHISADLDHRLEKEEREFLNNLETSAVLGDYFFAHAGARPGIPLDQQSEEDLLWIRRSFLDHGDPFEKIVVHGHTPTTEVIEDHRRIGLDTKAYETGRLTAMRFLGNDRGRLGTAVSGDSINLEIG